MPQGLELADTLAGSLPDLGENEPLFWTEDNKLVFLAKTDNRPHLYAVDTAEATRGS